MPDATIGSRRDQLDADRFVGRTRELDELESLLVDDPAANVVLVHGPGGIGKSALLRELARRATKLGWSSVVIEGRDLPSGPESLDAELRSVVGVAHALVVFDSWERAAPLTTYLRSHLLVRLPAGWLAIVASRDEPDAAWTQGGWEHVTREMRLSPLGHDDALECLRRHGIDDESRAEQLAAWAAGSPLALVLGARVGATWQPATPAPDELIGPLVRRVISVDLDDREFGVLAAAAFARITTAELLRAARPGIDVAGAYEWLATRSFTEPLRDGIALHSLFASVLREYVARHHGDLARDLRRRIADYAYITSLRNGDALSYDLASLLDDPVLRWGFGWDRSGRYRLDRVRPGDVEALDADPRVKTEPLWDLGRKYFEAAPEFVVIVRDIADAIAGFAVVASTRQEPPFPDPMLVPRLTAARERAAPNDAVVWTLSTVLDDEADVRPLLGFGGVLRAGVPNPRYVYLPIDRANAAAVAFSESLSGHCVADLDFVFGSRGIECHEVDFGPGGMLGLQRELVYRELGLEPPVDPLTIDDDFVRALLRDLPRADRLAASPFASGATRAERAESVRRIVNAAVDRAFGPNPHDERLREVLTAAYLERVASHESVAASLHMSRSAYFRLAHEAVARLTSEFRTTVV